MHGEDCMNNDVWVIEGSRYRHLGLTTEITYKKAAQEKDLPEELDAAIRHGSTMIILQKGS